MKYKIRIMMFLYYSEKAHTLDEIRSVIGGNSVEIQDHLHELDDQGTVLMRNGLYRLSEYARRNIQT